MLTYFPTPLPGEWWYSVLCRYHVRSGHSKYATTISELYSGRPMVHGRLIPGGDCAAILAQLPLGVLSIDDILANHTLLPYYTRFFAPDKKRQVWDALLDGHGSGITSLWMQMPDGTEGLKYCPMCYQADTTQYGEPYWHSVHQIPLLPLCPTHKVLLVSVPIKFSRLSELFLPLVSIRCQNPENVKIAPWMEPLTDIITALLCGGYAPTMGHNNLHTALISHGYGEDRVNRYQSIDVGKVQRGVMEHYGGQIYGQYFEKLSAAVMSRMTRWQPIFAGSVCTVRSYGWPGCRHSIWTCARCNRSTAGAVTVLQGYWHYLRKKRSCRKDGHPTRAAGLVVGKVSYRALLAAD